MSHFYENSGYIFFKISMIYLSHSVSNIFAVIMLEQFLKLKLGSITKI